jgi:aminoglycoside 3-N-acetyltransferase
MTDLAIAEMLSSAGVVPDGILFVHAAFRALKGRGHRAEAFIEGLINYMGSGTVVMPAMSWRVVTPENPEFDELATISHVGILAEIFRTRYATQRSLHPTHSVSALGRMAPELVAGHHLDDTPCSLNSPYGRASRENAWILLLGIGLERCTAIHHGEERIAPDIYLRPAAETELYRCRSRTGIAHTVRLRRHLRLNRDFPQFERPLAAKGLLRRGELDGTPWMIVTQRDLLAEVSDALTRDPRAIIAPPGAPIIP